jgi:hypothetical protein
VAGAVAFGWSTTTIFLFNNNASKGQIFQKKGVTPPPQNSCLQQASFFLMPSLLRQDASHKGKKGGCYLNKE